MKKASRRREAFAVSEIFQVRHLVNSIVNTAPFACGSVATDLTGMRPSFVTQTVVRSASPSADVISNLNASNSLGSEVFRK
jgi:hypothetical protein